MTVLYTFDLTPPDGAPFQARIVQGETFAVETSRDGIWRPDPSIRPEDLLRPEYRFAEWDVQRVDSAAGDF